MSQIDSTVKAIKDSVREYRVESYPIVGRGIEVVREATFRVQSRVPAKTIGRVCGATPFEVGKMPLQTDHVGVDVLKVRAA